MTIQQILTKIQNETYGEEVRQAIADGLQLCYDDKVLGGYCPVDDLNNYYSGAAFCTSSVANGPSQSSFVVMSAGNSEHCFQVAINILNINDGYTRKKQNNTWSQWIRLGVSKKIRYWNHDGTELLYTESVSSGGNGSWTGTATKEPTQQYEYTFVGWSTSRNSTAADPNATRNVTSNRDVYAAFTSSLRSYNVYFFNGASLLTTVTVPYGSNALYSGEDPTKASTAQYTYTFEGWNSHNGESSAEVNILNDIRDNKTVYAAFAPAVRSYNVYFYNGSELIFTDSVEYGSSAAYQGSNPTKTSTAQYSYAFSGWNTNSQATEADANALVNVVADRNVYAVFTEAIRTYTVRFMNGATVLQTVENVPYGGSASYTGSTPRHPTAPDDYTFVGFDPDGTNIIGATDCQAVYLLNPKTLRYWNYNGTELLHTESVEVGGDGTWNGTSSRASTTEHSYIFLGWNTSMNASVADPNAIKNITADRDVYAAFEETVRSYSVRFYNGSTLIYTDHVQYGANASYVGSAPTKEATAQYTYTFEGWNSQDEQSSAESGVLNNIIDDKDVYAAFSSTVNSYNVYFYNRSTLLYTDTVAYGSNAVYSGDDPTKASTAQYTYTFEGWNSQDEQSSAEANVLNNITADKTVYAAFSESTRYYTVRFYNEGTLLDTQITTYNSSVVYGGEEPTKDGGYTFNGWNTSSSATEADINILTNVTEDLDLYAVFTINNQQIYGITRTGSSITRTDDSVGLTASASVGDDAGHSDFDTASIYKDIKRVVFDSGDVMVQIPKFYYQRTVVNSTETIRVSAYQHNGFSLHPAFNHNGQIQDYIYIGAYETSLVNDEAKSVSGGTVLTGLTTQAHQELANAKDNSGNWWTYDVSVYMAIVMLIVVEFASFNTQVQIGHGNASNTVYITETGQCDNVPNLTGVPSSDGKHSVVWRGIENLWGNYWYRLVGLCIRKNSARNNVIEYFVTNNTAYYASTLLSSMTQLSYATASNVTTYYISAFGYDSSNSAYFLSAATQNASGYIGDRIFNSDSISNANTPYAPSFGGTINLGFYAGIFCINYSNSGPLINEDSVNDKASRLLYIPLVPEN